MRIVFMGTPDFAVPSLEALAAHHDVVCVLTRPDAVRSRGKEIEPYAIKAKAVELDLDVHECSRITDADIALVEGLHPDIIVVAAFGAIVPDAVLEIAPLGCINVHASLLPRWRGAAPIQRAILAGDPEAGVSIMEVVHDLDAGAYCIQASTPIGMKSAGELTDELAHLGADALIEALGQIEAGTVVWTEQVEDYVTYAHKIEKAEMLLDPEATALFNCARVQASSDAAPARCIVEKRGVRILRAHHSPESLEMGEVAVRSGRVFLGCAVESVEVFEVKPDGKRAMEASAWAAGLRDAKTWCAIS